MRVAIFGLGKMGRFYDNLLHARYVVDVTPPQGRVAFTSVEEFLAYRQPVDLAIVASTTKTHYKITRQLLEADYDVLVEKPICLSSREAEHLESIAAERGRVLYQSTLERYNPLVKFLRNNVDVRQVSRVESFRFGKQPPHAQPDDAKFDLAIHDIDLWFHLFRRDVPWTVHAGYGEPRREIVVTLKKGGEIRLDLLNKFVLANGNTLDFSKASPNNPILEMLYDLTYRGLEMNEAWSREIRILESAPTGTISLS